MQKIARGKNAYYGYIEEIWELNYGISIQIPIFKYQWVKHRAGHRAPGVGLEVGRSGDWSGRRDEKHIEKKEKNRNEPARFGPRSDFQNFISILIFQTFL
jgi:hypothetical protein